MSLRATRPSARRRLLTVSLTVLAVLALAVPPSLAATANLHAGRAMALSGDRTYLRTNMTVTDPAPTAHLQVSMRFGNTMDEAGVVLGQQGSTLASRRLVAYAGGEQIVNPTGEGCEGDFYTFCPREGFDWVTGRAYRFVIERGGQNDNGWLWTMSITDLETSVRTPLMTLRSPYGQLSATGGEGMLDLYPANCDSINSAAGIITQPRRRDGSAFAWGPSTGYKEGCSAATAAAPIVNGNLQPRITQ